MSRPNFENIDRWFFEYTEGNLSADQESYLMDFLELHPELMSELKIWTNAKVKAPVQEPFTTDHLIKATPFLYRPFAMVSIALVAILLTWLGIEMLPGTKLYTMTEIDTDIIDSDGEENEDELNLLVEDASNGLKNEISTEQHSNQLSKVASIAKTQFIPKPSESEINKSKGPIISEVISNADSFEQIQLNEKPLTSETEVNSNWEDQTEFQKAEHLAYNTHQENIQVSDLTKITDYLNRKDENANPFTNDLASLKTKAKNGKNSTKSSQNASTAKSALNKALKNTYRKLQRIADYPVALQNTKNPYFHAPMMTGYKANFAMAGSAPGNRVQATSRIQWLNESNSQLINSLSWDGYINAMRGGLGIDVNYSNYKGNELNNYSVGITYSPKFSLSKDISFEPAVRFKMGVINLDESSNSIGKSIELDRENIIPLFTDETQINGKQLWYRDVGLGFMLNAERFYAGFNADNLGRHYNNFYSGDIGGEYKADVHYTAVFGTEYASRTEELRLSGYGLYQKYGDLEEFWVGSNFRYEWMQIGAAVSNNLDFAASFGTVFKKFSILYNVDYTNSQLLGRQVLSHQATMRILMKPSRSASKFIKL